MESYKVITKTQRITSNTALAADGYGGWNAVNLGDTDAQINGVTISAGGSLIGVDFTSLAPNVEWAEPITIAFSEPLGSNPLVVITRLKYRYAFHR